MIPEGMQKYRSRHTDKTVPKAIRVADERIRIEWILSLLGVDVPETAVSWKSYCPFGSEHKDGGVDKNFRVYSESNSVMCFALHGRMGPVQMWAYYTGKRPLKAAEELLDKFNISLYPPNYKERMATLRDKVREPIDKVTIWDSISLKLRSDPAYLKHQYDPNVLRVVNLLQRNVSTLPEEIDSEELLEWHSKQIQAVESLLTYLRSKNG